MKRIALATAGLAAVAVGVANYYPAEVAHYGTAAGKAAARAWDGVESNPFPVALAVGTFLLTVGFHVLRGKTLRESVEVAATRVTLVPVPTANGSENPVVARAKARATRTQLIADQIALQARNRKLPEVVVVAEKEACYAEQAVRDAERVLAAKQKALDEAEDKLAAVRKEKAAGDAELAAIDTELKKLAELV